MSPEYLARLYVIAWLKVANRNPESGQMNETECCWSGGRLLSCTNVMRLLYCGREPHLTSIVVSG